MDDVLGCEDGRDVRCGSLVSRYLAKCGKSTLNSIHDYVRTRLVHARARLARARTGPAYSSELVRVILFIYAYAALDALFYGTSTTQR